MAEALHVVGGSIASLMAALAAGRHRPVELYADPARAGGGFGGLPVGGLRLNLGMRLLELDYEDGPAQRLPLGRYDPAVHDHRPFADTIRALVAGLAGDALVRVTPEMGFGRQRAPCALTTADIATLPPLLAPETRARIAAEAAALLADPAPPPWRFLPHRPAALDGVGLEAASRDNHGATLHALLLAPVAGRLDPGWANCPAGHRRKLWAALFHPLTVLEAFRDGRTGFRPHRPFWTLRDEGMAGLVGRIMAALKAMPLVRLHPVGRLERLSRRGAELVLDFGGPGARPARRARLPAAATVIGLGAEEAFAAAGIAYAPARLSAGFAWMRVAERDLLHGPAALLLCGAGAAAFRISDNGPAGPGQRVLAIEFGHRATPPAAAAAAAAAAGAGAGAGARRALEEAGLLRPGAPARLLHAMAGPAQVAPTAGNHALHGAAAAAFGAALGGMARVLGGARRFGFESFNDQVVDGLHTGDPAW